MDSHIEVIANLDGQRGGHGIFFRQRRLGPKRFEEIGVVSRPRPGFGIPREAEFGEFVGYDNPSPFLPIGEGVAYLVAEGNAIVKGTENNVHSARFSLCGGVSGG